jgi:prepilin-type processing-associated H-X9-DG protein
MVHITEAHVTLPIHDLRWHDAFFASQLPFGAHPRIANDQRHPGGINALFFDSHAETMKLTTMDPGWPEPLHERLRYFTVMPPGYQE